MDNYQSIWQATARVYIARNPSHPVGRAKYRAFVDGVLTLEVNNFILDALAGMTSSMMQEFNKFSDTPCHEVVLINPNAVAAIQPDEPPSGDCEAELSAALKRIEALESENQQLNETIRMMELFNDHQQPSGVLLPGQVVIDLNKLRAQVAILRQHHHGRNALVELLVGVDAVSGTTKISAADLSQAVGLASRTSYQRMFGDVFSHEGKTITLEFVAPRATLPHSTPQNVAPHATSTAVSIAPTEDTSPKMLYPVQRAVENVAPHTTSTLENAKNVVPGATNDGSYDMNECIYKKSTEEDNHSFIPPTASDSKPPLQFRPVIYWLSQQTGWNWKEWEKIDWQKRPIVEWIALGLHVLDHADDPGALFASMSKKYQPLKAKYLAAAQQVKLPPLVTLVNGKIVGQAS